MKPFATRSALEAAASAFDLPIADILGPSRKRPLVRAHWAVMLALRRGGWSNLRIANAVGRIDSTTVGHGLDCAKHLLSYDERFLEAALTIEAATRADETISEGAPT
jgi:chromosomal replication initiation ATPase DnaA